MRQRMHDPLARESDRSVSPLAEQDRYADLRSKPRVGVLIRAAKLVTPMGEFLCVLRDVSETGFSARTFHELPDCGDMMLELQNGDTYEVTLVWQSSDRAGFRFKQAADVQRFLESPSRYAKRPVRLNIEAPIRLITGIRSFEAGLLDLSQQGAKVQCAEQLPLEARVTLQAEGLPETRAQVRWRRNGLFGLAFMDTMQFGELACAALAMQQATQQATQQK